MPAASQLLGRGMSQPSRNIPRNDRGATVSDILYRADGAWADLSVALLGRLNAGQPVVWIAFSQAITIFANLDGQLTRTRQARPGNELPGDGMPLVVEAPLIATGCGFSDDTGYRSTRPLLVATAHHRDDITRLGELARDVARQLHHHGRDLTSTPEGHPEQPCRAPSCAMGPGSPSTPVDQ